MPKRKRLFTPLRSRARLLNRVRTLENEREEVSTARGRLKGALLDVLDPLDEDTDPDYDPSPRKRERVKPEIEPLEHLAKKHSYVLKLFDRSVDLSQFEEESPLYPICRAWIANKPKADYSQFGKEQKYEPELRQDSINLPGPNGAIISRIPELLPEQIESNKDNINLNYKEAPPPIRDFLLSAHLQRWTKIRRAWIGRAAAVERRYSDTQDALNAINVSMLPEEVI